MSPEERLLLQKVGKNVAYELASSVPATLLYALCAPIFAWVISFLIRQKSRFQIFVIAVGLGGSTINFAINTMGICFVLNVLSSNQSLSLDDRVVTYNLQNNVILLVNNWISFLVPIVNDSFIVWRAWILFQKTHRRHWTLYALGVLCFISSVITLVAGGLLSNESQTDSIASEAVIKLSDVGGLMSFITNGAATAVIGQILWNHFKSLPRNNKLQIRKNFNVWRVLALLVETGTIYGVLQLIDSVFAFSVSYDQYSATLVYIVISATYYSFSYVYPALTLYLIRGPFSLAGTHESIISAVISDDLASQDLRPDSEVV